MTSPATVSSNAWLPRLFPFLRWWPMVNRETLRAIRQQEIIDGLLRYGVDTVGTTPEEVTVLIKSEMAKLGKIIRDAGIRGQ